MAKRVERDKWILYRHTCKYEVLKFLALDIKGHQANISKTDVLETRKRMELFDYYRSRNKISKEASTIDNKIKTLEFWMFGYKNIVEGDKKFIFSPLGNLFLKHIEDEDKCRKVFLTMTFGMQFQHPNSKTKAVFQVYPFRIIYKLLCDKRIDNKLYDSEYTYVLPFVENLDESKYELLVKDILSFRELTNIQKASILKRDEHTYVNSYYEWQFTQTLFDQIGIINRSEDGEKICELYHPYNEKSSSMPTKRIIRERYVVLNESVVALTQKLLKEYVPFDEPVKLNNEESMYFDAVKEIYNFYPNELLEELKETDKYLDKIMRLPRLIDEYSNNNENSQAYLFEDVLTEAFNLFVNIEAIKIGGGDNTDIECLYLPEKSKFAVEAKSTANKLNLINANRLKYHREKIGGKYTIVITPRYVPAALRDINGTEIVIIKASTFTEYLYNNLVFNPRDIDYAELHEIIKNNLGNDISKKVSALTFSKYA